MPYCIDSIDWHIQIAKPAKTDFEQSMLPTFDNRKVTNFT